MAAALATAYVGLTCFSSVALTAGMDGMFYSGLCCWLPAVLACLATWHCTRSFECSVILGSCCRPVSGVFHMQSRLAPSWVSPAACAVDEWTCELFDLLLVDALVCQGVVALDGCCLSPQGAFMPQPSPTPVTGSAWLWHRVLHAWYSHHNLLASRQCTVPQGCHVASITPPWSERP